jgi:two-component system cell cycle sensor histidine kinase/response regulator CckA
MRGKTVLIVDDEPGIVNFVAAVLSSNGYGVLEATDPVAALRLAEQHTGPIDLLLTDVRMPGLLGPELCERMRPQRPETRYLLMSGEPGGVPIQDLPLLAKPFLVPELLECIRRALEAVRDQPAEPVLCARMPSPSSSSR